MIFSADITRPPGPSVLRSIETYLRVDGRKISRTSKQRQIDCLRISLKLDRLHTADYRDKQGTATISNET